MNLIEVNLATVSLTFPTLAIYIRFLRLIAYPQLQLKFLSLDRKSIDIKRGRSMAHETNMSPLLDYVNSKSVFVVHVILI